MKMQSQKHPPLEFDHLDTGPLIKTATVLQKSSQQKKITEVLLVLNMELDSLFAYYCVHGEKLNLLSWAIRLIFTEPVTFALPFSV